MNGRGISPARSSPTSPRRQRVRCPRSGLGCGPWRPTIRRRMVGTTLHRPPVRPRSNVVVMLVFRPVPAVTTRARRAPHQRCLIRPTQPRGRSLLIVASRVGETASTRLPDVPFLLRPRASRIYRSHATGAHTFTRAVTSRQNGITTQPNCRDRSRRRASAAWSRP
jgi:hypothetical protein